jgi:hypothetical protein
MVLYISSLNPGEDSYIHIRFEIIFLILYPLLELNTFRRIVFSASASGPGAGCFDLADLCSALRLSHTPPALRAAHEERFNS